MMRPTPTLPSAFYSSILHILFLFAKNEHILRRRILQRQFILGRYSGGTSYNRCTSFSLAIRRRKWTIAGWCWGWLGGKEDCDFRIAIDIFPVKRDR